MPVSFSTTLAAQNDGYPILEGILSDSEEDQSSRSESEGTGGEDQSEEDLDQENELKHFLGQWITDYHITGNAGNAFLKGLKCLKKQNGIYEHLPNDIRTLLKTPRTVNLQDIAGGRYFHFGLETGILNYLVALPSSSLPSKVHVIINVDGIPLTRSSRSNFWPICGLVTGSVNPFPIGVFHGPSKPDSANEFLDALVKEYNILKRNGLTFNEKHIDIKISGFVCDAPARSFLTGTAGHTSKEACPKCTTIGTYVVAPGKKKGRVTYPDMDAALRTHESFIEREHPKHHKMDSILEEIGIDLVDGGPLDYMHVVLLGVMRKLLNRWVKRDTCLHLITDEMLTKISQRLVSLSKTVPSEFVRKPRPLTDLCHWKATEYRQFLLYSGPLILKDILPGELYQHFIYLHCGIKILCSKSLCIKYNNYASKLLRHFLKESRKLYGDHFVSYNVHCMIHLPRDVLQFGPLDNFSCFPFKNFLQSLKSLISCSRNPLCQLVKRLSESSRFRKSPGSQTNSDVILSKLHTNGPVLGEVHGKQYRRVRFLSWNLTVFPPNNCIFLDNNAVVVIENFIETDDSVNVVGREYVNKTPFYANPTNVAEILSTYSVSTESELKIWPLSDMRCKAFCMPLSGEHEESDLEECCFQTFPTFLVFPLMLQDKSI